MQPGAPNAAPGTRAIPALSNKASANATSSARPRRVTTARLSSKKRLLQNSNVTTA
jgi:hypothetical protein